ncbi:MAG TPA: hypothetical protein GXX36_11650 [Clostridiaceae bacterium]|nr:hypothetical protein [Clostridiaceae bacterium]
MSEILEHSSNVESIPESKHEIQDAREKNIFAAFGWDPAEFRRKMTEYYYHDFLEKQETEYTLEFEKYGDLSLYHFSDETFTMEGPNCYAFAMKLPLNPLTGLPFECRPTPGDLSHGFDPEIARQSLEVLNFGTPQQQKNFFYKMMKDDASVLGMDIKEVEKDYQPGDGEWMIALAVTDNLINNPGSFTDFHFYRKGEEGNWYHKPGTSQVENTNARGNLIFDPSECDRGEYKHFLGYYAVKKLSGLEVEHE